MSLAQRVASRYLCASRPIHEIAEEVRRDWKPVNFAAKPYLEAMMGLDKITDTYGSDPASMIINYFLVNASSWRGPKAKEIKAELKKLLKGGSQPAKRTPRDLLDEDAWGPRVLR